MGIWIQEGLSISFAAIMSTADNSILGLKMPTDPRWVNLASMSLKEILADHAFCEQKAATQCISLIQLYPEKAGLVDALSPIVTEEWGHFRMVWWEMKKRGYELGPQRKDEYVNLVLGYLPKGGSRDDCLLQRLMVCALIEARSCERFRLLSEQLEDEDLKKFYYRFMVSEAGHYRLFIDLAEQYFPQEQVRSAWQQWLDIERQVLTQVHPRGDRMH